MTASVKDIFCATETAKRLLADYKSNNVSHAYMLIGEVGSGKNTLARAFAKLIMCQNPKGTEPCDECSCCQYFDSFSEHPNVTVVSAENKASIGVADIRSMAEGLFISPYIGSKKIYIIKNAEKMTQQAQNALLKILEEPPEYVVFFLLASNRYQMLPTVISRCRTLNMSLYSADALRRIAFECKPELSAPQIDVLLHRCQGLPSKLISVIDSDEEYRNGICDTVSALLNNDVEKIFDVCAKLESRDDALAFVSAINEIMRDAIIHIACNDDNIIVNTDKVDLLGSIAEKATLKQITAFLSEAINTQKMLLGNVSYQLCVKSLLMKW